MRVIITALFLLSISITAQAQKAEWHYDYKIRADIGTNYLYFDNDTIEGDFTILIAGKTLALMGVKILHNEKEEIYLILEIDKHEGDYVIVGTGVDDKRNFGIRIGEKEAFVLSPDMTVKTRYVKK